MKQDPLMKSSLRVLYMLLLGPGSLAWSAETVESLQAKAKQALAQIEGKIAIAGLQQPVEVLRDAWGVPHIYAQNQHDLFFAQGVVAAQDRLFQMDLWRRSARGETAAAVGPSAFEADRFARLIRYRGDLDAEWAVYSPDAREIAASFVAGINAYVDLLGDALPLEFQLAGFRPGKFRPEDCLGRMSGITMVRNFRQEVNRARLVAAVGIEKARWLSPGDPPIEYAQPEGLDLAGIDARILAGYEAATRLLSFDRGPQGSNNWAVDGTLSRSGKPLMASDPHRALTLPSLRYLVHLHAPGWNVIGGGEPALPGVALGHNEHVAWGFTIVGNDQADLYVEETHPDDPKKYRVGAEWREMEVVREEIEVRGATPQVVELRFTRHGPVLHQDEKRRQAYVLRWVGALPGGAAYMGSLALDRAHNAEEFVKAIQAWRLPSENIVYADTTGNIGWVAAAQTPIRPGWDGLLPVPGADDRYSWQGFLPYAELPQVANPPEHFVSTANHNILPQGYTKQIAYEWAPPYRQERILQRLRSKSQFDLADMQSIQHDDTTLPGLRLAKLTEYIEADTPLLTTAVKLLQAWDGALAIDSQAGAVYGVWLQELQAGLYQPHVPESMKDIPLENVPVVLAALEHPDKKWFGADPQIGRDRLLKESLSRAISRLQRILGNDPAEWRWGRLHTIRFPHPLASLGEPFAKAFNLGPVPRPGDGLTPNATRHNPKFDQVNGATYRHVFDLADWDRGMATSAPGQSGQPGSPHYDDLLALWAEGKYFPLVYSRESVEEHTKHRLELMPK
jgi:penicillin amidase